MTQEKKTTKVIGFTTVHAPSKEHPSVPYHVALLRDSDGKHHARKTFTQPVIGAEYELEGGGSVSCVGIAGTGVMAAGIAVLCLEHGLAVAAKARSQAAAAKLVSAVNNALAKKMDEAQATALAKRFTTTFDAKELSGCQIVIEAVSEDLAVKQALLAELDAALPPSVVLASNTSSLSIKEIAAKCRHKERVAGMHFFNPVPRMQLVEVVVSGETGAEAEKTVCELAHQLGKTPITVKDTPAFIVNRLLMPFLNDAIRLVEEGVAAPDTIDSAVKLGLNHPMGPLALVDLIGIDVFVEIMRELERKTGDSSFAPRPLALKLLKEGKLGRKTGEGFYTY